MKHIFVLVVFIFTFLGLHVLGQTQVVENAQTFIPPSLMECYRNQTLRSPENRLPMTIETFIDLVRKVESYQKGTEDVMSLSTSMLHRFRLDGIQLNTDVQETEGVVPYAVSGRAFFKHRLVLKYLIPSNNLRFPNESLSQIELCTLHFMLSHTIERSERGDEGTVCGKLEKYESRRSSRIPRDARYRRQIEEEEEKEAGKKEAEKKEADATKQDSLPKEKQPRLPKPVEENQEQSIDKPLLNKLDKSVETQNETETTTLNNTLNDTDVAGDLYNSDEKLDTEVIVNTTTDNQNRSGKLIFDDDIQVKPEIKSRRLVSGTSMPSATTTRPYTIDTSNIRPRVSTTIRESDCPMEYGVVRTKWGTVSMGTVLAGIAAGLYSQQIQVQNLVLGGPRALSLSKEVNLALVDNKFATTLTGDLSEVAIQQGPKGVIKIGTSGGWNSTVYPKWYFDQTNSDNEMTDAEIRGGLDGLIMSTQIQTWRSAVTQSRGILKLSQLLDMYYSEDGVFDEKYRACDRKNLYPEVAPVTTMQEQAFRFAMVLDQHTLSAATVDEARIQQYSADSVNKLMNYLPQMIDDVCIKTTSTSTPSSTTNSPDTTRITPYANITVVIDSRWTYTSIKSLLFNLMQKLNFGEFGSKMTVIDGKNRTPFLVNAIYTTDIETNFTENSYSTHERGMDIPKALELELKSSMKGILTDEDTNNIAGGRSTIVLFIPSEAVNLNQNDLTIAKNQVKYFRENLPDVTFLYLAPGSKENYKELVDDITTDVFTYTYFNNENEIPALVDQVVNRIKKVPIRLSNPNCGENWSGKAYNMAEFTYSVKQYGVNYHRLHPNYFFGIGSAEIKIQSITGGTLKVCFSRRNEFPDSNSTSDSNTKCQQISSDTYTYKLSNPCEGFEYISQCQPLYISVASTTKVQTYSCVGCQYPHNVQYKISNLGLGCTSGVAQFLGNSFLIVTFSALVFMLKNIIIGT